MAPAAIGVVLAGGRGRRVGGAKALLRLGGRPLIEYPLRALRDAVDEVVVVAKRDTPLPRLGDVPVWIEPDEPRHPLTGILHALRTAAGRPVAVCAVDLPLVTAVLVSEIIGADAGGAAAVVATTGGALQPLLARYEPDALELLAAAGPARPLRETVLALEPALVEVGDERLLMNVNTPGDLARAGALLS